MKKLLLKHLLSEETRAAKQAHKLNLRAIGFGYWEDKKGNTVAKTEDGMLKKLSKSEVDKTSKSKKIDKNFENRVYGEEKKYLEEINKEVEISSRNRKWTIKNNHEETMKNATNNYNGLKNKQKLISDFIHDWRDGNTTYMDLIKLKKPINPDDRKKLLKKIKAINIISSINQIKTDQPIYRGMYFKSANGRNKEYNIFKKEFSRNINNKILLPISGFSCSTEVVESWSGLTDDNSATVILKLLPNKFNNIKGAYLEKFEEGSNFLHEAEVIHGRKNPVKVVSVKEYRLPRIYHNTLIITLQEEN